MFFFKVTNERKLTDTGFLGHPVAKLYICVERVGPSGVRALPLAAGINVGGHYKWHFFLFLSLFLSGLIANSPRRGCPRNSNLCMWS